MTNILPFKKKPVAKRSTLCENNHHQWKTTPESRFDVKQGKLVTVDICTRCGKRRHRLS